MNKINIGIFLRDYEFAFNLGESLAAQSKQMSFSICKEERELTGFDAVISDCRLNLPNNVVLVNSETEESLDKEDFRIFRYTDTSGYVKKLAYYIYECTGKVISYKENKDIDVVSIISPYGGSGVSEIALGMCRALNDYYGKRCIYVNLSAFDSSCHLDGGNRASFKKLMYYLKYKEEFPVEYFVMCSDSYDYVEREALCLHADEFTHQMFRAFCNAVSSIDKWGYVVLDIGNEISLERLEMLKSSDFVVAVRDMRCFDEPKEKAFYGVLAEAGVIADLFVANFCGILDDIDEEFLDIQKYEDVSCSDDFQMKMSVLGKRAGGENE